MKLLIIAQKIDLRDPVLSFFHGWVLELAKHFESIVVICLEKGESELPMNVKVLSLGKEKAKRMIFTENMPSRDHLKSAANLFVKWSRRLQFTTKFYGYIWQERNNYDAVFVHMNQEYVLLGAKIWLLLGKKVYMWRNHHAGTFLTDLAAFFCIKVFCTSRFSYTAKYKKTVFMPVGIDTEIFEPNSISLRVPKSILFLGRIAPVKRPDLLVDALIELSKQRIDFTASFYGSALPDDREYYESLKMKISDARLSHIVKFYGGIPNREAVEIYNRHEIFVNLSSSGMYDKTIFEAMACGTLVLASNNNLHDLIDESFIFEEGNKDELVTKLIKLLFMTEEEKNSNTERFRKVVQEKQGLQRLGEKIFSEME